MKKTLSVILAILMIVSTVPFALAVQADYEIKPGETISITVPADSEGEYIYIKFIPEVSGEHTFVSDAGGKGDPYAQLCDEDMNLIATDDDGREYPDFKLQYEFTAGETYYLGVRDISHGTEREWSIGVCNDESHTGGTQTCQGYLCEICGNWYGEAGEHDLDDVQTCLGYYCCSCYGYFGEAAEHDLDDEQTCRGYYCHSCYEYYGEADPDAHDWNGVYCELCEEEHEHTGGTQTCRGYLCEICENWYGEDGEQHDLSTEQTCKGYMCNLCYGYYGEAGEHDLSTEQTCLGYCCYSCYGYYGEADETKHGWDYGYCRYCGEEYPEADNCEHNWRYGVCNICGTRCSHEGNENRVCAVCSYSLPFEIKTGKTVSYYGSFESALENAEDGSVIKLLEDGLYHVVCQINKAITLDLNGKEWSQASSASWDVCAEVTFTDSVGGGYLDYGLYIYSDCTFSGGRYRHINLKDECPVDSLTDLLAPCHIYCNDDGEELDLDGESRVSKPTIKEIEHSITTVEAKAPTCTDFGWDAYEYCTACEYSTYAEKEALSHDIVIDKAVAPKCGETGLTAGQHCSRCNDATEAQGIVPALEHKDTDGDYKCDNGCGYEYEKPADPTPDTPDESETPDEPADEACADCGKVHTSFFSEITCFFTRIINFIKNLFAK